jgi:hypothetical protein
MITFFSQDLGQYYEAAQSELRSFVAALPCEGIASISEGYVSAHCAEFYLLKEPTLDSNASEKNIEGDGTTALYVHPVTNAASLHFKPSQYQFGGWRYALQLHDDRLFIRIETSSNPPPKKRHEDIIAQLQANIFQLRREIEIHNRALLSLIPQLLAARRKHCEHLTQLRDSL